MYKKKSHLYSLAIIFFLILVTVCCKKEPVVEKPDPEPDDGSISGTIKDTLIANVNADPNVADCYITGVLSVDGELKVDSGVLIEMGDGASIVIKTTGTIIAKGSASHPITITGRTKTRGAWKYIMINSGDPRNELSYVNLEYGGGDNSNNGAVYLNTGGYVKIQNSKFSNCKNNAVVAAADDAVLNQFTNNIIENNEYTLQIRPNQIPQVDNSNTFTNNNNAFITIEGSTVRTPLTWDKKLLPYKHKGTTYIEADVVIAAGVNIQMDYASLIQVRPEGTLNAAGSASERIVFSSADTVQGYWQGLLIQSRSNKNSLSYVDISYAGGSPTYIGSIYIGGSVSYPEAILSMNNCSVNKSASWGIYVQSNASLVNAGGNVFSNNIMGDIGP